MSASVQLASETRADGLFAKWFRLASKALYRTHKALILPRLTPDPPTGSRCGKPNQAAAMIDALPQAADRPSGRRDREITPDLDLEYLYPQLTKRVL